jgi:basic membrane protein A and related proteins
MRGMRSLSIVACLAILGTLATSCSSGNPCKIASDKVSDSGPSVGVSFDVGGIGDKSFNDAAKRGLDQAISEGVLSKAACVEPNATGSNRDDNTRSLADDGYDMIFGIGFAFSVGINGMAGDFADQHFGVVDGYATCDPTICTDIKNPPPPNVLDLDFQEHEGSFLVGAAAALEAKKLNCTTLGFLGGQTGFLIGKFETGFIYGAREVNPDIDVLVEYIGDDVTAFNNTQQGEALSTKMYDGGACIIYHAAGASGGGLFTAAVKADKLAIGVDSDQYNLVSDEQKPHVFTSMIKKVDTAVYDAIKTQADGTFEGGKALVFGLAQDGVDFSTSNTALMTQDIITQVDRYKQQIIDGTIEVPPCDKTLPEESAWCT